MFGMRLFYLQQALGTLGTKLGTIYSFYDLMHRDTFDQCVPVFGMDLNYSIVLMNSTKNIFKGGLRFLVRKCVHVYIVDYCCSVVQN